IRENRGRKRGESSIATMTAPSTIVLPRLAPRKRRYIKIVDVRAKTIVTVLELLSPANKKGGADRTHYLEKRNEYLASGLSFVEVDLLRGGRRLPLGKTRSKVGDYYAMVCRAWEFPRAGFWTFGLRDPLPDIPVPLTEELGDTRLRLRSCVNRAYEEGRYSTSLSYDEPLEPRPLEQYRDWIAQLLTKHSR